MTHPTRLALLSILVLASCGGSPPPRTVSEMDRRSIVEQRALDLILEVLRESNIERGPEMRVNIGAPEGSDPFDVDVRVGTRAFGIEWVSPQDRADHGTLIPEPDPGGQLRIMAGMGDDADAQILVLEHRMYRYDPDLERVEAGATGVHEAEGRLKRDVRDFLEYVRGQGGL